MTILNLFINFLNKILSIKILNLDLINWLIIITIITFVFGILKNLGGKK